jgi:hypothetical protein
VAASGTIITQLGEPETAQLVSETQMPQGGLTAVLGGTLSNQEESRKLQIALARIA